MSDTPLTDAMQDATDWEHCSYAEQLKDAWEHARKMEERMHRAEWRIAILKLKTGIDPND